ncbi:MAG TPA: transporter substrate-binding domain-containing protein [Chitinolyticbacter sp.]|nr:transporter substrate-binding domain-containing protein [Chitinolyticbacter sp.]
MRVRMAVLAALASSWVAAAPFVCGVADGYPPYQYRDAQGHPAGLDVDVARLVFARAGHELRFTQDNFDELISRMAFHVGRLDGLCGAELSVERARRFAFSRPYFARRSLVFVPAQGRLRTLADLKGKVVAGDRQSFAEEALKALQPSVRIMQTGSKATSFELLAAGKVAAVIAPEEVGRYLALARGIAVRTIDTGDPGTPVSIVLHRGDAATLRAVNDAIDALGREGKLGELIRQYQH